MDPGQLAKHIRVLGHVYKAMADLSDFQDEYSYERKKDADKFEIRIETLNRAIAELVAAISEALKFNNH